MPIQTPPRDAGIFGQGIKYPPSFDANGRLKLSWGTTSVDEQVLSVARTQRGERVMQPDYGRTAGLGDLLDLAAYRTELERNIAEKIPVVDRVEVIAGDPDSSGRVIITVKYRASGEANDRVLTYPIFIGPST